MVDVARSRWLILCREQKKNIFGGSDSGDMSDFPLSDGGSCRESGRVNARRSFAQEPIATMTSEAQPFVHLRVHSAYSLLEGALTIHEAGCAGPRRRDAGARADRHQQSVRRARILRGLAEAGIQPIVGLTLSLAFLGEGETSRNTDEREQARRSGRIALLAKDEARLRQSDEAFDRGLSTRRPRARRSSFRITTLVAHARGSSC